MAKSKKRFVEYLFEFVEPIPWQSMYEFERDLGDFFMAHGVEAEVSGLMEGYAGRRIVTLTKTEVIDPKQLMTTPAEIKSMKDQFKNLKMPSGKKVKK